MKSVNFLTKKSIYKQILNKNFSNKTITVELPSILESSEFEKFENTFPKTSTTNTDELVRYYKTLYLWRRFEYEADNLYKQKFIRGFCHLYIGQEAICLGMEEGLTKNDPIISAYRVHCQALARGFTPRQVMAEMMSKHTGSTKGKGGSMHYYNTKEHFYGGHGIVGAQIPLGTGLAFGIKYKNQDAACFTLYGDGSTNQGQLLEASNMAGLMKLPICYVIENNKYAMGTASHRHNFHHPIMSKFRSFPGVKVDGQCVFNMREWSRWAKKHVIKYGPMFMEIDTYRYQGHSMSDPGISYRSKDEVTEFRKSRDCIAKIRKILLDHNLKTEKEIEDMEEEVKNKLDEEIKQAQNDPFPNDSELFTEVYYNQENMYIRSSTVEKSYHLNLLEGNSH